MHKAFKVCTAVLLALVMTVSLVSGALAVAVRNDDDTISYEPLEQGVYSKGGYTIDKVSHPTLGAGEVDGILTGDLQDRGQSYSWSMAEAGDYVLLHRERRVYGHRQSLLRHPAVAHVQR